MTGTKVQVEYQNRLITAIEIENSSRNAAGQCLSLIITIWDRVVIYRTYYRMSIVITMKIYTQASTLVQFGGTNRVFNIYSNIIYVHTYIIQYLYITNSHRLALKDYLDNWDTAHKTRKSELKLQIVQFCAKYCFSDK